MMESGHWTIGNRSTHQLMVNSSTTTTAGADFAGNTEDPRYSQVTLLLLLIFSGIAANILAFVVTLKLLKEQRKTSNLAIAMTTTDLFAISIAAMPTTLCYLSGSWIGGDGACAFQAASLMFVNMASPGLTVAMSLERYFAVNKPYFYKNTISAKKTGVVAMLVFAFSIATCLASLFVEDYVTKNLSGTYCSFDWASKKRGSMAFSIFVAIYCLLSSSATSICNIITARSLLRTNKRRSELKGGNCREKKECEVSEVEDNVKANRRVADTKFQLGLTKPVIFVSIANVICWTPHAVRILVSLNGQVVADAVDKQITRLLLLTFLVDPFVYTISRKQCRKMLRGWICRCFSAASAHRMSKVSQEGSASLPKQEASDDVIQTSTATTCVLEERTMIHPHGMHWMNGKRIPMTKQSCLDVLETQELK